ncbi:MAG: WXG100 family type VII secretion target [Erysipelotrichaceae bacterium]|nr:WXG100 family type VII secretion target [Erysipelotrichaceae bacterium]
MSNVTFDITPEDLEGSATRLRTKMDEFQRIYDSVFNATRDLNVSYKGEASSEFNSRIENYRPNFDKAKTVVNEYIDFLNKYANDMKTVENDLRSKATSL